MIKAGRRRADLKMNRNPDMQSIQTLKKKGNLSLTVVHKLLSINTLEARQTNLFSPSAYSNDALHSAKQST